MTYTPTKEELLELGFEKSKTPFTMPTTTDIPTELIERALGLTGKKEEYLYVWAYDEIVEDVDYPKFYAYLLTPEFLYMYRKVIGIYPAIDVDIKFIGEAIYEHQKGNSGPLISLLNKL